MARARSRRQRTVCLGWRVLARTTCQRKGVQWSARSVARPSRNATPAPLTLPTSPCVHVARDCPARRSRTHCKQQELLAIQQSGPRDIGFFGTRNMGFLHQQLIEILSYAMVLTVRDPASARVSGNAL